MKKISHKLFVLLVACSLGFVALGIFSIYTLNSNATKIRATESKARINGALYNSIIQGKDCLADVLPPPAYVIESYLTALQLSEAADKAGVEDFTAKLKELHKEFNDSYSHWTQDLPAGDLKEAFVKAGEPAVRFYDIVDRQLLPSIAAGDRQKTKEIVKTSLLQEYDQQRAEIDKVVTAADNLNTAQTNALHDLLIASEKEVSGTIRSTMMLTISGILAITVAVGILGFLLSTNITKSLKFVASHLTQGADQVSAAASQVSSSSQSLAEGASEQAASLEETSSSLEEMASMTKRNSENAQKANDLAKLARGAADTGVGDMQTMITAMEGIKDSSNDIAKIIKTIDEIAFQTNILALNAAVEAARAGDAGMGFAVVADEVRNLAQRSAQAAKETAGKIEGAIAKTGQGVEISAKVAQALNDIAAKVRQVDELVAEVATASLEQTQGITQVNTAVGQMDKVTQSNAANAEESAAAAQELSSQSEVMKNSVGQLLELVDGAATHDATGGVPHERIPHSLSPAVKRHPAASGNGHAEPVSASAAPAMNDRRNRIPMAADFKSF